MQYSQEYRYADISGNLDSFVENVSGRYIEKPGEVFDTKLTGSVSRKDLTEWLLLAAVFLFVMDVVVRRMRVDWLAGIAKGWKRAAGGLKGKSAAGKMTKKEGGKVVRDSRRGIAYNILHFLSA